MSVADTAVEMPTEQEVCINIEDGKSYTVVLYDGRLDVVAFKERLANDGLVLNTLNGAVPAHDISGMSRTLFSADISGETQIKRGTASLCIPCGVTHTDNLSLFHHSPSHCAIAFDCILAVVWNVGLV